MGMVSEWHSVRDLANMEKLSFDQLLEIIDEKDETIGELKRELQMINDLYRELQVEIDYLNK